MKKSITPRTDHPQTRRSDKLLNQGEESRGLSATRDRRVDLAPLKANMRHEANDAKR